MLGDWNREQFKLISAGGLGSPGGASHIDLWDYKPELEKRHDQPMPGAEKEVSFQGANGNLMRSPWGFVQRGQSGKYVTTMLPHLGGLVDDMAFIHSMTSRSNTHGPARVMMNTGFMFEGFPSAGSWVTYALGSENENLPPTLRFPMFAGFHLQGPPIGPRGFFQPNIRASRSMQPSRSRT